MKVLALISQIFAAIGCAILLMTIVSVINVDYSAKGLATGIAVGIGVNVFIIGWAYLTAWFFFLRHCRKIIKGNRSVGA